VEWDDFLLALPERKQLVSFTKDVPLFVRYLKVVTDLEGRSQDFLAFLERAKSGLVVESDVYITTEELLAVMWKNGYSDQERNAVQFTFPGDYKFHYPELSAMFDIPEEDTYKFCMRTRTEQSHIGELDWSKVQRKGFIRDHWLIFGTGLVIFKYFPFFNYYFGIKVFGTSMWCVTMYQLLNRWIAKSCRRNEYMAAQKTAQDVMDGEDKVVESMKRFSNDAKCTEYLADFKMETESKISDYRKALVMKMKDDLTERATKQLQAIASFEATMGSALQELVVREAASSFRDHFPGDADMQSAAFTAAVKSLSGQQLAVAEDPVSKHFSDAFASLEGVDVSAMTGDPQGSLAQRIAFAQQSKEAEFKQTFMVSAQEAAEIRAIAGGSELDLDKLTPSTAERLDALYSSINAKVGYSLPETLGTQPIKATTDMVANAYIEQVNVQLAAATKTLREARLKAFVAAF